MWKFSFKPIRLLFLAVTLLVPAIQAAAPILTKPTGGPYMDGRLPTNAPALPSDFEVQIAFTNLVFQNPMGVIPVPGSNKLAVWEREGKIWTFENSPDVSEKDLILDLTIQCQGWGASGIYSAAFHPGFSTNAWLFVYYTWVMPGTVGGSPTAEPTEYVPGKYHDRVSRFTLIDGQVPSLDDEVVLIDQTTDSTFHSGGSIFFHPEDGFLYWCNGEDYWNPAQAQVITQNLFGGVFRLDVDQRGGDISHPIPRQPSKGTTANYFVPNDNPFVGVPNALEEFYALGLRNPYRMTVDAVTKRIFIGDVGNNNREEVNTIEPSDPAGLNFQWNKVEGLGGSLVAPYFGVSKGPLLDYDRSDGVCIIGGHVYRGTEFHAELGGRYIFGDNGLNKIWTLDESTIPATKILLATIPAGPGPTSHLQYLNLSSFGLDNNGEILICRLSTTEGRIYKLVRRGQAPTAKTLPKLLSETGLFQDTPTLVPSTNLIPYEVNSPLWSDGADKMRWFTIPKNTSIHFSMSGEWKFPAGSVFVKHFEVPSDTGIRRLETRLVIRSADGRVFGGTYKWRSDNSEADLVEEPLDEEIAVSTAVGIRNQIWHYPSPSECLQCHTPASQGVLGLNTRQLNKEYSYAPNISENQIKAYNNAGLLYPALQETNFAAMPKLVHITNSTASLEARARSYLDSNCSHCHRPGAARTFWDARFETPLELSGIINGPVSQSYGLIGAKTIAPGHPEKSIILSRADSVDPGRRMPPLAKNVVDTEAVEVLAQYIASLPEATNSLPAGWKSVDIGPAVEPSSVSFSANSLSVNAGDGEIYYWADKFNFVYHPIIGDGELIARVSAISGYHWGRTGPMIRASLDPGSLHAHMCLATRQGVNFFYRSAPGGDTTGPRLLHATAPQWLKVTRTGNTFAGYYSADGTNWTQLGTTTIDLPSRAYIGFASSGIVGLGNFVIDNIQTVGVPNLNVPPSVQLTAQVNSNHAVAGPMVLSAAAQDSDGHPAMVEFYEGDTRLGQATTPPFELLVHATPGTNQFSVRAYDNVGAIASTSIPPLEFRNLEISLPTLAGDRLEFSHFGNPGVTYITEGSPDFSDWQGVTTNSTQEGVVHFSIPLNSNFSFFRVRPR